MYNKIVIGLDQSYHDTGICVIADRHKKRLRSIPLHKEKCNSDKRRVLSEQLDSFLRVVCDSTNDAICIIERIRLRSQGFVNIDYIKSIGALNAVIIDKCAEYGVEVYSVDTRCWKAQVVGTSKGMQNKYGVPEEKWPTVRWCLRQGWESDILEEVTGKKTKGTFVQNGRKYLYNDNIADSAGIAMFGFVGNQSYLKREV